MATKHCAHAPCGKPFDARAVVIYCSDACGYQAKLARRPRHDRICDHCRTPFTTVKATTRLCSAACSAAAATGVSKATQGARAATRRSLAAQLVSRKTPAGRARKPLVWIVAPGHAEKMAEAKAALDEYDARLAADRKPGRKGAGRNIFVTRRAG